MVLHVTRHPIQLTVKEDPPIKIPNPPSQKMKPLCVFLLALAILFSHTSLSSSSSSSSPSSSQQLFETWCEQYGKSYSSEEEKLYRFSVFEDNLAYITQHNDMGNSSYTLSLNDFADLTHHEFKTSRLGLSPAIFKSKMGPKMLLNGDIPSSVDWRKQGVVTNVKDQGSCGVYPLNRLNYLLFYEFHVEQFVELNTYVSSGSN